MILIKDDIMPRESLEHIVEGLFESGFGTWKPDKADLGHKVTPGMNWQGMHAPLHVALYNALKEPVFPNHSFFKVSTKEDNVALVHSDHNDGHYTAILYLSEHSDYVSGTGFYRHLETGRTTMPSVQEMVESDTLEKWNADFIDESKWEQTDFIRGIFGRLLIFSAPMFHSRVPRTGSSKTSEDGRIVWVCHFLTAGSI